MVKVSKRRFIGGEKGARVSMSWQEGVRSHLQIAENWKYALIMLYYSIDHYLVSLHKILNHACFQFYSKQIGKSNYSAIKDQFCDRLMMDLQWLH